MLHSWEATTQVKGWWRERVSGGALSHTHAPVFYLGGTDDASHIEMTPNALQALDAENRCLKLEGLSKVFSTPDGPRTAVNHLNFTMYESQIFVLLGHNGAGMELWVVVRSVPLLT